MIGFDRILAYLRRVSAGLNALHVDTGINKAALWTDYTWCAMRHGCLIGQYVDGGFWRYNSSMRKRVLTQGRLEKVIRKCNKDEVEREMLNNKGFFNAKFTHWVRRRWIVTSKAGFDSKMLFEFCLNVPVNWLIIKPTTDYEGHGIQRVKKPEDLSGCSKLIENLGTNEHIIEECLETCEQMRFGNSSVNTVRLNTVLDKDGNVHIFKPVLRVGVGEAICDNYNAGGVEYAIDPATGILIYPGFCKGCLNIVRHPGTDIVMPGYQLPS